MGWGSGLLTFQGAGLAYGGLGGFSQKFGLGYSDEERMKGWGHAGLVWHSTVGCLTGFQGAGQAYGVVKGFL